MNNAEQALARLQEIRRHYTMLLQNNDPLIDKNEAKESIVALDYAIEAVVRETEGVTSDDVSLSGKGRSSLAKYKTSKMELPDGMDTEIRKLAKAGEISNNTARKLELKLKIYTIGDLMKCTRKKLYMTRSIGQATMDEIDNFVERCGLKLKYE